MLLFINLQVEIETQKQEDVLVVSNEAIKPYQGGKAVQVEKNNSVIYMPVEVGVVGITYSEIVSGLEEGQEIIVGTNGTSGEKKSGGGFGPLAH